MVKSNVKCPCQDDALSRFLLSTYYYLLLSQFDQNLIQYLYLNLFSIFHSYYCMSVKFFYILSIIQRSGPEKHLQVHHRRPETFLPAAKKMSQHPAHKFRACLLDQGPQLCGEVEESCVSEDERNSSDFFATQVDFNILLKGGLREKDIVHMIRVLTRIIR